MDTNLHESRVNPTLSRGYRRPRARGEGAAAPRGGGRAVGEAGRDRGSPEPLSGREPRRRRTHAESAQPRPLSLPCFCPPLRRAPRGAFSSGSAAALRSARFGRARIRGDSCPFVDRPGSRESCVVKRRTRGRRDARRHRKPGSHLGVHGGLAVQKLRLDHPMRRGRWFGSQSLTTARRSGPYSPRLCLPLVEYLSRLAQPGSTGRRRSTVQRHPALDRADPGDPGDVPWRTGIASRELPP